LIQVHKQTAAAGAQLERAECARNVRHVNVAQLELENVFTQEEVEQDRLELLLLRAVVHAADVSSCQVLGEEGRGEYEEARGAIDKGLGEQSGRAQSLRQKWEESKT